MLHRLKDTIRVLINNLTMVHHFLPNKYLTYVGYQLGINLLALLERLLRIICQIGLDKPFQTTAHQTTMIVTQTVFLCHHIFISRLLGKQLFNITGL